MRLHRIDLMTRGRARRASDRSAVCQKCVDRGAAKEPARESIFSKRELLQGAYLQGSQALRRGGDGEVERAAHRLEALAAVPPGRAATPASVYAAGDVFFPSLRQNRCSRQIVALCPGVTLGPHRRLRLITPSKRACSGHSKTVRGTL